MVLLKSDKDVLVNVEFKLINVVENSGAVLRSTACMINESDQIYNQKKIMQLQVECKGDECKGSCEINSDVEKQWSLTPRELKKVMTSAAKGKQRDRSVVVFELWEEMDTSVQDYIRELLNEVFRDTSTITSLYYNLKSVHA